MATEVIERKKSVNTVENNCVSVLSGLNGIIIIVGICVSGFGVFVSVGGSVLRSQFDTILGLITEDLQLAGLGEMDMANFHLAAVQVLQELATPLIVLGVSCSVLSLCGAFAARKRITVLVVVYSVFVGLGVLVQAGAMVILFSQRKFLDGILKPTLLTGLQEHYRGYNETDLVSQTWNIVMLTLHCCGINDYRDFYDATHWRRRLFQDGWWFYLQTPITCCNMERKDPDDFACAVNPLEYTSNFKHGCYDAVWTLLDSYRGFMLAALVALMLLQLVLLIASTVLARELRKKSKTSKQEEEEEDAEDSNDDNDAQPNRTDDQLEGESVIHTVQNRKGGHSTAGRTDGTNIFNSLPFLNLGGRQNNDPLQQNFIDDKRNSFSPDLLSQFLSGQGRYSRMSYDLGFPHGRMPSFEFSVPNNRMSFDYGVPQVRIPSADYGVAQGPIVVQLQQESNANMGIKAITESVEEENNTNSHKSNYISDSGKAEKSKVRLKHVGRCKSENCMNSKEKNKASTGSRKGGLSRRETLPRVTEEKSPDKDQNED